MLFKIFGKSGNPFAKGFLAGGRGGAPRSPASLQTKI